ncbi:reverse transcriptase domain-containing protein [Tanacetum coccineum]
MGNVLLRRNCKKVGRTITQEGRNPTAARNQRTHTCYECGSLRHFKSKCPIVKFQKYVNKKISTLSERQAENKRKLNNTSKNNQNQQQPNKRQNTGKELRLAGARGRRNITAGPSPLCPKINYHYDVHVAPKCHRRDCPERKNQSHKNQIGGTGAHGVVHTLRGEETDQDPNNIKDEIKA